MSARVPVYVKVVKTYEDWVEISAVTTGEAMEEAVEMPNVVYAIGAQYDPPEDDDES